MSPPPLPFAKMHGCANDYVVVDGFADAVDDPEGLARGVCDRRRGVGADGLLLLLPAGDEEGAAHARMRMFNVDGSEAEMCGNGLRCLVKLAWERGRVPRETSVRIATGAGVLDARVEASDGVVERVAVDMGTPRLERAAIPMQGASGRVVDEGIEADGTSLAITAVSMGNPHAVTFVDDVEQIEIERLGRALEHHAAFPRRTNVEFVEVVDRGWLRQRTWERGCGETPACGTGACAVAVAGALTGRSDRRVRIDLRGGRLDVHWRDDDHVVMAGPAEHVFDGTWLGA